MLTAWLCRQRRRQLWGCLAWRHRNGCTRGKEWHFQFKSPPLPPQPGKGRILHSPGSSAVSYPKFQQEARKQAGSLLVGFCVYFSHGITKTTTTTATNEQALFAKLFRIAVKLQNHLNLIGSQLQSLLTLNRHMQCMWRTIQCNSDKTREWFSIGLKMPICKSHLSHMSLKFEVQLGQSQLIALTFFHFTAKCSWVVIKSNTGLHVIVTWKPFHRLRTWQNRTDLSAFSRSQLLRLVIISVNFSVNSLTHLFNSLEYKS